MGLSTGLTFFFKDRQIILLSLDTEHMTLKGPLETEPVLEYWRLGIIL